MKEKVNNKEGQIKAIGITSIIAGALLGMIMSLLIPFTIFEAFDYGFKHWLGGFFLTFMIIFAIFIILSYIIGGIGLLNHKNWARILLIIVSFLQIFNFPIGTGLSIWFLIVLFNEETKKAFT